MLTRLVELIIAGILKYLGKAVPQMLKEYLDKREREKLQAEAKKKLDDINANPASTHDEKLRAYEEFINSGN